MTSHKLFSYFYLFNFPHWWLSVLRVICSLVNITKGTGTHGSPFPPTNGYVNVQFLSLTEVLVRARVFQPCRTSQLLPAWCPDSKGPCRILVAGRNEGEQAEGESLWEILKDWTMRMWHQWRKSTEPRQAGRHASRRQSSTAHHYTTALAAAAAA